MAHRPSLFLVRILGARFPFFFYPLSRSVKDLFSFFLFSRRSRRSFVDNFSLFFFPRENLKIVGRTRDGEKWGVERRERVTAENRPHRRSLLDHDANHFPVLDKFVSFRLVIAFVLQQRHCSLASPPLLSRAFFFFSTGCKQWNYPSFEEESPLRYHPLWWKKSNRTTSLPRGRTSHPKGRRRRWGWGNCNSDSFDRWIENFKCLEKGNATFLNWICATNFRR